MIIFFGVRNYGKQNAESRNDVCEMCGAFGKLQTFDTAKCFHIFWIPLIPTGRKRVIDACPNCKQQREMGLRQYNKTRAESVTNAIKAMQESPDDADAAISALQTFIGFGELDKFEASAGALADKHAGNADVQKQIAATYAYLGKSDDAMQYYGRALTIQDDPETREQLAVELLRDGRAADAEPHLAHVAGETGKDQIGVLYLLADAYAHQGAHDNSLRTLERIESINPLVQEDKEHLKLRKSYEKARKSGKPLRSTNIGSRSGVKQERPGLPLWLPQMTVVILAAIAGVAFLVTAFRAGQSREVWLVNGTSVGYDVLVNGERHKARKFTAMPIQVAEGTVEVRMLDTPLPIPAETHEFRTPFFSRLFANEAPVINADRQAVLVQEPTLYTAVPVEVNEPSVLFCGSGFYTFSDVDYAFREFPHEISLPSSSSRVRKSRVFLYRLEPGQDELSVALQVLEPEQLEGYLHHRIRLLPNDIMALNLYFSVQYARDPDALLTLLGEGASQRPIRMDWHRLYQELMEAHRPDHDLYADYEALLASEPDSGALKYLLARIMTDQTAAEKLFLEAEEDGAAGFGFNAIAYAAICSGKHAKGLEYAQQAVALNPERPHFREMYIHGSIGSGELDQLLAWIRNQKIKHPIDGSLLQLEGRVLAMSGRTAEAVQARELFVAARRLDGGDANAALWDSFLSVPVYYVEQRIPEYLDALVKSDNENAQLYAAFCTSNLVDISISLEENGDSTMQLLAYCMAKTMGDDERSQAFHTRAHELLEASTESSQIAAGILAATAPPPGIAEIHELQMLPGDKLVLAAALGLMHPKQSEIYFQLARQLNYDHVFPYHLIADWVGTEGGQ